MIFGITSNDAKMRQFSLSLCTYSLHCMKNQRVNQDRSTSNDEMILGDTYTYNHCHCMSSDLQKIMIKINKTVEVAVHFVQWINPNIYSSKRPTMLIRSVHSMQVDSRSSSFISVQYNCTSIIHIGL